MIRPPRLPVASTVGALMAGLMLALALTSCGDGGGNAEVSGTTIALTADRLPVIVATQAIPRGTPAVEIDDGDVEAQTVTRANFPADAVIDLTLLEGTVTRLPIEPGAVLRHAHFE